jgi:RNA polymerase sigma factor (sigma-70 family)
MSAVATAAVRAGGTSDADLVAAVRAGDAHAFGELYRRHHAPVNAFVRRIVRDEGRAEDVTQEAFLSALRGMRRSDRPIAFRPWLYEIARNASIDAYRRGSRAQEVSIDVDGGLGPADARRLTGGAAPDTTVIHRERFDHLRGALDELSETHHQIVVMRELEGLSYREIGERMQLSPSAVESTLFRARRRLEHEYDQLSTGNRCLAIGFVIGRLAEGDPSARDRKRLDRHARRCSICRLRARQAGVEPILEHRSIAARVAALLPFPFLGRRGAAAVQPSSGDLQHSLAGLATTPGVENGVSLLAKGAALVAAVALVGGGGATLGGVGPVAPESNKPAVPNRTTSAPRDSAPGSRVPSSRFTRPDGATAAPKGSAGRRTPRTDRHDGSLKAPNSPTVPSLPSTPATKAPGLTPAGKTPPLPGAGAPDGGLPLAVPSGSTTSAPATAPSSSDLGLGDAVTAVQGASGTLQGATSGH